MPHPHWRAATPPTEADAPINRRMMAGRQGHFNLEIGADFAQRKTRSREQPSARRDGGKESNEFADAMVIERASDAMNEIPEPSPAPAETATDLFRALKRLHAEGRIALSYDFARLHHMDCPIPVEADGNILAYAVIAATLLALWLAGWQGALAALGLGAALYFSLGQRFVRSRIRRRIEDEALASFELWQRLWRFGGVGLVPRDDGAACLAPDGNWMGFVRTLRGSDPAGF